jgi:hypothetical protein
MQILKAFAWMRWRVLMNSLERSGARDVVERFSIAIEQLGPIMAALVMIPSAILLAGAGAYGGWALAQGNPRPIPFEALRFLLLAACVLAIVGPLMLPAGDRTNVVRLLLLPISRQLLYTAQAATTLTDPWVLLVVPAVATVPFGLLVGGAWGTAVVAAGAGTLLVIVLIGLTVLATSLIHLIVRNRRRGELLMLIFILVLPLVGMFPVLWAGGARDTRGERRAERDRATRAWVTIVERRVLPLVPSEMYVRSTRSAADQGVGEALVQMVGLVTVAAVLHTTGFFVFGRMLDSPGTSARRKAARAKPGVWRIPGVTSGTSAVALNQIRLAFRTPRGRSILLSPLVVFIMFSAVMWRGGAGVEFGFLFLEDGISLAIFGSFVSLLAILPFAMNQFAIDRAGLTLTFLSPLDDQELLHGKAIGNAVVAGVPALFCVIGAALLFRGASLAVWLLVPLGLLATYSLMAPVAAVLSAVFPRSVDLNSIGNGSNAHGAAGLLGFLSALVAGAATLVVALVARRTLGGYLSLLVMLIWGGLCVLVARILFMAARRILSRRRENLALIGKG